MLLGAATTMKSLKVFTLSILLLTILIKETVSYNRQLANIYRHHRNNFHPLYRTEVLDLEECTEEQCERDIVPQIPKTLPDLVPNDDFNDLWPETMGNDLNKRGNIRNPINIHPAESECKIFIASFKNNNIYTKNSPEMLPKTDAVCSCGIKWKSEFLGNYHYPRTLTKAYCESPCRIPPPGCKDKFINVYVLRKLKPNETNIQNNYRPILPRELQSEYLYESISMPIQCDCS